MRRKRKRIQKQEHKLNESWLLPYSDLMTLLLALFIVLFSISSVDAQKFEAVSRVFGELFTSGTGVFDYPNPVHNMNSELNISDQKENNEEQKKSINFEDTEHQLLANIQTKVNQYIQNKELENQLSTSLSDEGLRIMINDSILFDSGSADVREKDVAIAKEISDLLVMEPPHEVIISGHTDNVPIHNAHFESNWELSATRALNFMKIILENEQLDPRLFSAKGYGEFKPIATNDTAEGRQKNRRVEVLILPNESVGKNQPDRQN